MLRVALAPEHSSHVARRGQSTTERLGRFWRPRTTPPILAGVNRRTKLGALRVGLLASAVGGSSTARADALLDADLAANEPAYLSSTFLDPLNRTRAHVTTRFGFFDQTVSETVPNQDPTARERSTVNGSVEILFVLRGTDLFSVSALFPIGWEATDGFDAIAMYGNTRLGFELGGEIQIPDALPEGSTRPVPKVGLAGSLDFYLPTAIDTDPSACGRTRSFCRPMLNLRSFRALEPELWTNDAALVRGRWHTDFRFDIVQAEVELALSPGVTIEESADFVLLGSWATRFAVLPVPALELFTEIGASYGLVVPDDRPFPAPPGFADSVDADASNPFDDDLDTPVRMTLGGRLHIVSASFDPAIFVSFDFDDANVMVGLDLAGMVRSRPSARQRRERDPLDF